MATNDVEPEKHCEAAWLSGADMLQYSFFYCLWNNNAFVETQAIFFTLMSLHKEWMYGLISFNLCSSLGVTQSRSS